MSIGASSIFGLQKSDAAPHAGYLRFGDNTGWKFHLGRAKESPVSAVNTDITGSLLTVQDDGKVGIGTTSPFAKLSIEGSSSSDLVVGESSGVNAKRLKLGYNTAENISEILSVHEGLGYTPLVLQRYGGNVGIGTTSPQATLDVNGFMRMSTNAAAPAACTVAINGSIALTSLFTTCACKGATTTWVSTVDGTTACVWM